MFYLLYLPVHKKANYILEMQLYECNVYFNAKTDLGTSESYGPICWLYAVCILDLVICFRMRSAHFTILF